MYWDICSKGSPLSSLLVLQLTKTRLIVSAGADMMNLPYDDKFTTNQTLAKQLPAEKRCRDF